MKVDYTFLLLFFIVISLLDLHAVEIKDGIYEEREHFIITTQKATYYFDKSGGGLSRMIDSEGNDWIRFKKEPWGKVPESSASAFRGIPNAVFQGEDGGCGHPGFEKCISSFESPNIIRSRSISGKWEWTWEFQEEYAVWNVLKTDTTRNYWFLYEGTVGGSYLPRNSYWGNNLDGPSYDIPNHMGGERVLGKWNWAYFGRTNTKNILFLMNCSQQPEIASFSYMGSTSKGIDSDDGMVVFGFGRTSDSKSVLHGNHQFIIGFIEMMVSGKIDHLSVSSIINHIYSLNCKDDKVYDYYLSYPSNMCKDMFAAEIYKGDCKQSDYGPLVKACKEKSITMDAVTQSARCACFYKHIK